MSAADVDLHARLKTLADASKGISGLTSQLARWSPDQELAASTTSLDRSTPSLQKSTSSLSQTSTASEPTDRVALAAEIHQRLKDAEEDLSLLYADAADLTAQPVRRLDPAAEQSRVTLVTQLQKLSEDLASGRSQFRKAQLQAKRAADSAARKERQQLLFPDGPEGATPASRRRQADKQAHGEDQLRDAASDVTLALRRTHQRMTQELQRSEFARSTLQRSNQALTALNTSYNTLDGYLKASRGLIETLRTSQKSDTWYLETALWVLVTTIVWLFFRRVLYGPVLYLIYRPSKFSLQLLYSIINATVGLFGVAPQFTSLKVQSSATGRAPTRHLDVPDPSVHAGGGGKDIPVVITTQPAVSQSDAGDETLIETVGKLTEQKHLEEQVAEELAASALQAEREREQLEKAQQEQEQLEKARQEQQRKEAEEKQRQEQERREQEAREQAEQEERERAQREKAQREEEEMQRLEQEQLEQKKREEEEKQKLEQELREVQAREKQEQEQKEKEEQEQREREEKERLEQEAQEQAERERLEQEEQEQAEKERREQEKQEALELERQQREQEEQEERERLEQEERERAAQEEIERQRREAAEAEEAAERAREQEEREADERAKAAAEAERQERIRQSILQREQEKAERLERERLAKEAQDEADRELRRQQRREMEEREEAKRLEQEKEEQQEAGADQAEETSEQQQQGTEGGEETTKDAEKEGGDDEPQGTVLRERRPDEPANPKKRMMEKGDEEEEHEHEHDEL